MVDQRRVDELEVANQKGSHKNKRKQQRTESGKMVDDATRVTQYQNRIRQYLQHVPVMTFLKPLHQLKKTSYSADDSEHVKILDEYWFHMSSLVSAQHFEDGDSKWQAIGFQGKTPETDFRAMGLLAPVCLRYLAKTYPKQVKERYLERPYPFSCAGIAIISYIAERMWDRDGGIKTVKAEETPLFTLMCNEYKSAGFAKRCVIIDTEKMDQSNGSVNSADAFSIVLFEELFCILFDLFDRIWVNTLGTSKEKHLYFQFGIIMDKMKKTVDTVLGKNIPDYSVFKYFLFE